MCDISSLVPALDHELGNIVVTLDVADESVCEYFASAHEDALRISGDERPGAEEIVKDVNADWKPQGRNGGKACPV